MPPEVVPVQPDAAGRDRILGVIFAEGLAAGLPFVPAELAWEARNGDAWLGGLTARITQGWMFVHLLAVAREAQGTGLGSRLLAAAEAEAARRACVGVWLDTYSFQAPGFYERHGYAEVGRIPDYPPGHARVFLAKRLDGRPLDAGDRPAERAAP